MEEAIRTQIVVYGPVLLFCVATGIVYVPELFGRMQLSEKSALLGLGAVLVTVALAMNAPGGISSGLAMIGFILLVAPIAAQLANYFTFVRVPQRRHPDNTEANQSHEG